MSKHSREVEQMLRAWPGDLPELTAERAKQIIPRVEPTGPLKIAKRSVATGPQRSDSGAPNQTSCHCFPQEPHRPTCPLHVPDLITIELTREEAEAIVFGSAASKGQRTAREKLRAALKGNP